eukprot:IDg10246t1
MRSLQCHLPPGYISAFATPFVTRPQGLRAPQSSCFRPGSLSKLSRRWRASPSCLAGNVESAANKLAALQIASTHGREIHKPLRTTRVGLVATAVAKNDAEQISSTEEGSRGLFGLKARAYWGSMGFLPIFFTCFGVAALIYKRLKVMRGSWKSTDGVNRAMTPDSVITSPEMERELHVFKCGGCGYEIYPARGRE